MGIRSLLTARHRELSEDVKAAAGLSNPQQLKQPSSLSSCLLPTYGAQQFKAERAVTHGWPGAWLPVFSEAADRCGRRSASNLLTMKSASISLQSKSAVGSRVGEGRHVRVISICISKVQ